MGGLLRLTVPSCPPVALLGGHEIVGGCVAVPLELIHARMAGRRDHLAERYRLPPDPATFPAEWSEWRRRDRLQFETYRHREYVRLAAAVAEVEDSLGRGEDLEVSAVLFMSGSGAIERWSGLPILERRFVWAECRCCGRRYAPEECGQSDWSQVADPLAGVGGRCLACPAGHAVFAIRTWVA